MKYMDFLNRLSLLIRKNPNLIAMTLSNVFTMRLIGNKTHGDLAEIAISEFVNQYMYDYRSQHVGKDMFRAKTHEEDILVTDEISGDDLPISLKAYGAGSLQLSTDKDSLMFPRLEKEGEVITESSIIRAILSDSAFASFGDVNVMPLIYDEKKKRCNIMVFDFSKALENTAKIEKATSGSGRKHPVYRFFDNDEKYICEVRYGDAAANALQRGLWTHTENAADYFFSVSGGWIDYSHNMTLIELFSHALVASEFGHGAALKAIDSDIASIKAGGIQP